MVPADSDRIPRAPPYSGAMLASVSLPVPGCHRLRRSFPEASGSDTDACRLVLQPRHVREHGGLGSSLFDRHYWGNRLFLSSPPGTKMFQFPGFAQLFAVHGLQPCGLPHSDMSGSRPVCGSPDLFAAYHVLRRLPKPRHPPYALLLFL